MVQLKVYPFEGAAEDTCVFLDLYETQPIKLTLSIEDITSADATSVFSRTFKVPATRGNNEFFQNAYEIDGIDFDITIKKPAQILVDGAEFKVGHVRLQKIFANGDLDKIDYELLFLGETRDFSSAIGEATMCQLTMTDFSWDNLPVNYTDAAEFAGNVTYQTLVDSWQAFPQTNSPTAGVADGNLLFPLIDHGNNYDEDGDLAAGFGTISLGSSSDGSFTHQQNAIAPDRLKPMIRAKRLWDQIFQDAGYTYESNFLDSDQFLHMYVSAFGNNESTAVETGQITDTIFSASEPNNGLNHMGDPLYASNVAVPSPNYFVSVPGIGGSYFTVPVSATASSYYIMDFGAQLDAKFEESDYGYQNIFCAVQLAKVPFEGAGPNDPGYEVLKTGNWTSSLNWSTATWDSRNGGYQPQAGEKLQIQLITAYGGSNYDVSEVGEVYWNCTAAPGDYLATRDLDCEYNQIDYIKDVITMFRLVMQPSTKRPNHFIIEPWKDFIGSGEVYDWSKKLIREKDFVSEPLFNTQSATIEFTKQEDEDYINKYHQDNNQHAYGWLRFDSQNELLKGKRNVELLGIAPTPIDQIINNHPSSGHQDPQFILPQVFEFTGEQTSNGLNERLPIKTKTRFLFYNGLIAINNSQSYWYLNSPGGVTQQQTYPLVSPYEYWPVVNVAFDPGPPIVDAVNTLNLNFANDTRYFMDPVPGTGYGETPNTLFEIFWARYISSLYNKFSRRITAYFTLNNVDLQTMSFDDVIFVDGKYYRPEKIIDAQVGQRTAVKVQLITLKDQLPVWRPEPLTGFSIIDTDGSCAGEQGTIQITTNGTPPFTWQLGDPGFQTGNYNATVGQAPYIFTIDNVPLGSDIVTVTDSFGRTAQATYSIAESSASPVVATQTITQPTDCSSPCNGSILVTPSGGTAPYTITWQDPNVSGLNPTGLCPGDYLYYITDNTGCQSDTYEANLTCTQAEYRYIVREHLNSCTASGTIDYIVSGTQQLQQGDTVNLLERQGCYYIFDGTNLAPDYTIDQTYVDCAACTPVTANSYEVQSCTTQEYYFVSRTAFTLTPGQIVTLDNYPGCWEVVGDDPAQPTATPTSVFKSCEECNQTPAGFQYYVNFCNGLQQPQYFNSATMLQQGNIVKVSTGVYAGECVSIVSESPGQTTVGDLNSTLYINCDTCQGLVSDQCHLISTTATGAEISYEQGGQTYTVSLLANSDYFKCGQNFQVISGNADITNLRTTCNNDFDCRLELAPSCHVLSAGSTEAQFRYINSAGNSTTVNVPAFTGDIICADIGSVEIVYGVGASYQDQQSLCDTAGDCFDVQEP